LEYYEVFKRILKERPDLFPPDEGSSGRVA
jgi:hypothetical protein